MEQLLWAREILEKATPLWEDCGVLVGPPVVTRMRTDRAASICFPARKRS